jgi:hypothetical protein
MVQFVLKCRKLIKIKIKIVKIINNTMASKLSMLRGEERDNYTNYDSDSDYEEEFYDNYEPYEEDFDDTNGEDYQPPEKEEEYRPSITKQRVPKIKPFSWMNSPTKSTETSPTLAKPKTWWDKTNTVGDTNRLVNGVLNYAALLPPPQKKEVVEVKQQPKSKKQKKTKSAQPQPKPTVPSEKVKQQPQDGVPSKPTRFCLSVLKKAKCFHGKQCRFAHDYSDLKECNFGEKCKKIKVVKVNPDGTLEIENKNDAGCNFKHAKESKNSYLKRVPQQHTSPKK